MHSVGWVDVCLTLAGISFGATVPWHRSVLSIANMKTIVFQSINRGKRLYFPRQARNRNEQPCNCSNLAGMVYSLEPLLIILLVPLVSADSGEESDAPAKAASAPLGGVLAPMCRMLRWIQRLPSLSAITLGCYVVREKTFRHCPF